MQQRLSLDQVGCSFRQRKLDLPGSEINFVDERAPSFVLPGTADVQELPVSTAVVHPVNVRGE